MKPHLFRFVCVLEGIEEEEPLSLESGSVLAHTIKMALTYKDNAYKVEKINPHYSSDLIYSIPRSKYLWGKMFLSASAVVDINQCIHKLLHEMLLQKILSYIEMGYNELEAIRDFMILVGIDELVDIETLKKANYRLRKGKGIRSLQENNTLKKIIGFCPIRVK